MVNVSVLMGILEYLEFVALVRSKQPMIQQRKPAGLSLFVEISKCTVEISASVALEVWELMEFVLFAVMENTNKIKISVYLVLTSV